MNENMFSDYWREGTEFRIARIWNMDHRLPVPKVIACPMCGGFLILKDWKFHKRTGSPQPFRCDVRLKCVVCSFVPTFGVIVPPDMYMTAVSTFTRPNTWVTHSQAKVILKEDGYLG